MAEDYSEYVKTLRNLQVQKIADRDTLRGQLAAIVAALQPFARALLEANQIYEVRSNNRGPDAPGIAIFPLKSDDDCVQVSCSAQTESIYSAGPQLEIVIKPGSIYSSRILKASLFGSALPPAGSVERETQKKQQVAVFNAIIEAIAQLKADSRQERE